MTTTVAMREILQNLSSSHATLLKSLVENGKNSPYRYSRIAKRRFGPSDEDFPRLSKILPFEAADLPCIEDLRTRCLKDAQQAGILPERSPVQETTECAAADCDCAAKDMDGLELHPSQGLAKTDAVITPATLSFPCPYLEGLCGNGKNKPDTILREAMMACMMFREDTLLPLQHSSEGMTYTTLLSGSIIWVMWPSTRRNIKIVQSVYEAIAKDADHTWVESASELEGGVFFKQSPGECLRISPLCPLICLSTEDSILATYSILDAKELVSTLRMLPFLNMWFKTEIEGERKKREFNTAMIEYLETILQGQFDDFKASKYPYKHEGPLRRLLSTWDEVMGNVADLLEPADADTLQQVWLKFLTKAKGKLCWICGAHIHNKKKDLAKHFEDKHWPKKMTDPDLVERVGDLNASVTPEDQKKMEID